MEDRWTPIPASEYQGWRIRTHDLDALTPGTRPSPTGWIRS